MTLGTGASVAAAVQRRTQQGSILPADRDWFEERAGIIEFDGGLSREQAENIALGCLTKRISERVQQ